MKTRISVILQLRLLMQRSALLAPCACSAIVLILASSARADLFENWTWRNPLPTGNELNDVIYANGQFIAVGAYGTIVTSNDGDNWALRTSGTHAHIYTIRFGYGQFVAAAADWETPMSTLLTSTDGLNWARVDVKGLNPLLSLGIRQWPLCGCE
jgi:hypothetical protein